MSTGPERDEPYDFRSRAEHLAWTKARALEYCDQGDPHNALASFMSDLRKHPDTRRHGAIELGMMEAMAGRLGTAAQVREWIEGCS